jgi:hypothetical protein
LEALTLSEKLGYKHEIAMSMLGLAGVAAMLGEPERAVRLFGAAENLLSLYFPLT